MNYKEVLENLGYRLKDHGSYWRTNAVYRSGDNSTALQIYKDTGVWKDYVAGDGFLPFPALIEKTVGKDNLKNLTSDAFKKEVFGAPTFIVKDKIFWGQDRLEYAVEELNFN